MVEVQDKTIDLLSPVVARIAFKNMILGAFIVIVLHGVPRYNPCPLYGQL